MSTFESADAALLHEEEAIAFDCEGEHLVGILSKPKHSCRHTGVLIVVGGPQYRAGSHRQFVQLARELADRGWPCLRFDARGMGDSTGPLTGFEGVTADIEAALSSFRRAAPGLHRVVLWGLCDAASAALLYIDDTADERIAGLVLLNPWVRAEQTYARAQVKGYYARRVLSPDLWRSILRGGVSLSSLADFMRACSSAMRRTAAAGTNAETLTYQQRMARGWGRFSGPSLLVLSGRDLTASEFIERCRTDPRFSSICGSSLVTTRTLPEADHTLSCAASSAAHLEDIERWLQDKCPEPAEPATAAARAADHVPHATRVTP